ncbi:2'-5' RNA ligase family protein [Streptomyces sp. NPDC002851]
MPLTATASAFPTAPPPSLDDASTIAAHDWAAFEAVQTMHNHWERPGWSAQTRAYYWMLTFQNANALIDQAQHCQQLLNHLDFDPIDGDGLHLTLGRVGSPDTATEQDLELLVSTAASVGLRAFTLQALPLTASRGAIRYSVAPWTPVVALHSALSTASEQAGLPLKKPTSVLRPHIGIAYSNRTLDASPVREAVQSLRDLPPVEISIDHVELVELRREERAYRWRSLERLPLL